MLIVNADQVFSRFYFYKVYFVLRKTLKRDCFTAMFLMFLCLVLHRVYPEAYLPGIFLHAASVAIFYATGVQTNPMV